MTRKPNRVEGPRNIGSAATLTLGRGVYYFTPAEIANFAEPAAGTYGTSGRDSFRGRASSASIHRW